MARTAGNPSQRGAAPPKAGNPELLAGQERGPPEQSRRRASGNCKNSITILEE